MSVVPQATHGGVSSSLFGGQPVSPHLDHSGLEHSTSAGRTLPCHCGSDARPSLPSSINVQAASEPAETRAADQSVRIETANLKPVARVAALSASSSDPKPPRKQRLPAKSLHRIAEVRCQQGVSERTMARRLGMDLKSYRDLEDPTRDLTLSQLTQVQEALDVPIADLLEDHHALSRPVQERAKLLKVMKTAVALKEAKINTRTDRIAQMLCEQLVDLMPELADVSGWPQFGARRGVSAIGKVLQNPIDTSGLSLPE